MYLHKHTEEGKSVIGKRVVTRGLITGKEMPSFSLLWIDPKQSSQGILPVPYYKLHLQYYSYFNSENKLSLQGPMSLVTVRGKDALKWCVQKGWLRGLKGQMIKTTIIKTM